ncbi:MAG: cell cycle transcriptional regulator TrcR, partial [Bdellovibrionales bacterium]
MSTVVDLKKPMMPKATAVWLIDNTMLTFEQIGNFTDLHAIEVQALADGDIGRGIVGRSPLDEGILSQEEIDKAQADPKYQMIAQASKLPPIKTRSKGPKYTPVAKRGDKPDAIAFIVKNHPEISDAQICKLVGTTKPTIQAIRERTHANIVNIKPRNPVD